MGLFLYWLPLLFLPLLSYNSNIDRFFWVVTSITIVVYVLKTTFFRQMFRGSYSNWLLQNNWRPGQPLLRGRIYLQSMDICFLAPYVVIAAYLHGTWCGMIFLIFFLVNNVISMYFQCVQKKYMSVYLPLLAVAVLWCLPLYASAWFICLWFVANVLQINGLIRSWYEASLTADAALPKPQAQFLPWPKSIEATAQLQPPSRVYMLFALLVSAHLAGVAIAELIRPSSYGPLLFGLGTLLFFEICFVGKQVSMFRPNIGLLQRLRSQRYIIPYDRIFLRTVLLGGILLFMALTFERQSWIPYVVIPVPVVVALIFLYAGPQRSEWVFLESRHVFVLPESERQKEAPKSLGDYYRKYFQGLEGSARR